MLGHHANGDLLATSKRIALSAARSSGARGDVIERITHNARGGIIDVYTTWEWPALCEAVSCLKVDPDLLPGRIYDIPYDICVSRSANPQQSLRLFGGGGGNRTHVRKCSRTASTCVVCDLKFALGCAHKQARTNARGSSSRHCAEPDSQ